MDLKHGVCIAIYMEHAYCDSSRRSSESFSFGLVLLHPFKMGVGESVVGGGFWGGGGGGNRG